MNTRTSHLRTIHYAKSSWIFFVVFIIIFVFFLFFTLKSLQRFQEEKGEERKQKKVYILRRASSKLPNSKLINHSIKIRIHSSVIKNCTRIGSHQSDVCLTESVNRKLCVCVFFFWRKWSISKQLVRYLLIIFYFISFQHSSRKETEWKSAPAK